ncbi:cation:proton antiporter, partial [Candidatus Latescibacterota bacterium]
MAYILSLMADSFRIPKVLGYIIAGIIAGYNGFGLVNSTFIENIYFIESLFFMILISSLTRHICKGQTLKLFSKHFLTGVIASVGTFVLSLGFFAPLSISIEIRIIMCLFCATFSPVIMYALTENDDKGKSYVQFSFGGLFFALLFWSFFAVFMGSPEHEGLRMAFMPAVITFSSIIAGIVWGFFAEKILNTKRVNVQSIYPLAVVFLSYPFISIFGLDFIFIAFGIGIYNGVFSERDVTIIEKSHFSTLIIFALFGMHLSLEDAYLLGDANWKLVAVLVSFYIFSRLISTRISMHFISHEKVEFPSMIYFIPGGPMTLVLLRIFLPGFNIPRSDDITISTMFSILMVSMMIIYLIYSILQF